MINPNMPNMPSIPGMGAVTDTLEFVKNLWGNMGIPGMNMPGMNMAGMNVPGMVMPTLSVEELNKRIADMRAVESWLTLNMNMLRSTIQALEVQAATIATLQSMGESFSASVGAAMQEQAPAQTAASPNGSHAGNGAQGSERQHSAPPQPSSKDESDAASLTAPLVNAAAWWNMLQDQFQQAVSGAMSAEPPAADKPKAKPKAKAAAPAKPAASSTSTTRKRKTSK